MRPYRVYRDGELIGRRFTHSGARRLVQDDKVAEFAAWAVFNRIKYGKGAWLTGSLPPAFRYEIWKGFIRES